MAIGNRLDTSEIVLLQEASPCGRPKTAPNDDFKWADVKREVEDRRLREERERKDFVREAEVNWEVK